MKVYQIISEAPGVPGARPRSGLRSNAAQAIQARQQAAQAQQLQAQQQAAQQAKTQAKAAADSAARKAAHAVKVKDITTPPKAVRQLGRYVNRRKIAYAKNTARAEAIKSSYLGKLGTFATWLMRAFDLIEPTIVLWQTVTGLEDDFKNGLDYDGHPMTKEDMEAERDFAYGVFTTQIVAPLIARGLLNVTRVVMIARAVKNAAAVVSAPVSGGLSIGAALATEAGLAAFTAFLGSDTFQKYLADNYMTWVKGLGGAETWAIDGIWKAFTGTDYSTKLEKDKTNVQNKKALDTATTPQARQSAQQAIDTATSAQNRSDDIDALSKQLK
jgi:hypothetical protein